MTLDSNLDLSRLKQRSVKASSAHNVQKTRSLCRSSAVCFHYTNHPHNIYIIYRKLFLICNHMSTEQTRPNHIIYVTVRLPPFTCLHHQMSSRRYHECSPHQICYPRSMFTVITNCSSSIRHIPWTKRPMHFKNLKVLSSVITHQCPEFSSDPLDDIQNIGIQHEFRSLGKVRQSLWKYLCSIKHQLNVEQISNQYVDSVDV